MGHKFKHWPWTIEKNEFQSDQWYVCSWWFWCAQMCTFVWLNLRKIQGSHDITLFLHLHTCMSSEDHLHLDTMTGFAKSNPKTLSSVSYLYHPYIIPISSLNNQSSLRITTLPQGSLRRPKESNTIQLSTGLWSWAPERHSRGRRHISLLTCFNVAPWYPPIADLRFVLVGWVCKILSPSLAFYITILKPWMPFPHWPQNKNEHPAIEDNILTYCTISSAHDALPHQANHSKSLFDINILSRPNANKETFVWDPM